jgi:hypothetical protein
VQKKTEKKLTKVSLYVCMSAGKSEMLVFISVFFPINADFSSVLNGHLGKNRKMLVFYGVCLYVRPKLTFVSFYFLNPENLKMCNF